LRIAWSHLHYLWSPESLTGRHLFPQSTTMYLHSAGQILLHRSIFHQLILPPASQYSGESFAPARVGSSHLNRLGATIFSGGINRAAMSLSVMGSLHQRASI
jgi:hypothetical protein